MNRPTETQNPSPCPICFGAGEHYYVGRDFYFNLEREHAYSRCVCCGTSYHDPMPSPDEIAGYYPDNYMPHAPLKPRKDMSFLKRSVLRWVYGYSHIQMGLWSRSLGVAAGMFAYRDQVEFRGGGKALDIGCGNGKFLRYLSDLGWNAVGVDFSENAVRACREAGLVALHCPVESVSGHFELVTVRHVIEHVRDPHVFVSELARVTKAGGRVLIRTPNGQSMGRRIFGACWYHDDIPRHLIIYSLNSLDLLFVRHGFTRTKVLTFSSSSSIIRSLRYSLGNTKMQKGLKSSIKALSKLYVPLSQALNKGDELFVLYEKRQ